MASADPAVTAALVAAWHEAAVETSALLRELADADWRRATDLPGWDVHAVAAHLAHLESVLAGQPQRQVEVPPAAHVCTPMQVFTEAGVLARADAAGPHLIDEFDTAVRLRLERLRDDPPADLAAPAPSFAGQLGWDWGTLLRNRVLDVWLHQQDVRRAVGRPGGVDGTAPEVVARVFAATLPYVLAKRVGAPAGTTVRIEVRDAANGASISVAASVDGDGRGRPDDPDAPAAATVRLSFANWILLAGGRRQPGQVPLELLGDHALGDALVHGLAVTP